uniref:fluoride efflux transporter FluC n=1 Tax=Bifidobacterium adolescentis TaxID=1680 RepID=UPI00359C3745
MNVFLPIAVCLCGGIGASARYICDSYIKAFWHKTFPMSTFVINVIAGLLVGIIAALFAKSAISGDARLLLATGFLGGFSTFSTMMNETVTLLRKGEIASFAGYFMASVVVPVVAVACGYCIIA